MGQLLGITKWDQCYYKVGQLFYYKLKRFYYKVKQFYYKAGQVLQSKTIITMWSLTHLNSSFFKLVSYKKRVYYAIRNKETD